MRSHPRAVLLFPVQRRWNDRVLVIGDTRQHQGVDAGRSFQQMQEAGMQTSKLDTIMRQEDPELLKAVQHLATDETEKEIALLAEQGRVIVEAFKARPSLIGIPFLGPWANGLDEQGFYANGKRYFQHEPWECPWNDSDSWFPIAKPILGGGRS
jgi:hypothetical protein